MSPRPHQIKSAALFEDIFKLFEYICLIGFVETILRQTIQKRIDSNQKEKKKSKELSNKTSQSNQNKKIKFI